MILRDPNPVCLYYNWHKSMRDNCGNLTFLRKIVRLSFLLECLFVHCQSGQTKSSKTSWKGYLSQIVENSSAGDYQVSRQELQKTGKYGNVR